MKQISCLLILIILIHIGCNKEHDNMPPEITIAEPSDSSIFERNSGISIKVTADDPEGNPLQIFLYIDSSMVYTSSGDSLVFEWDTQNTTIGKHKIKASAVDYSNLERSAEISVTIIKPRIYDLFPLHVGNEYYYSYEWISQFLTASSFQYGYGNEAWKILSMSDNSDTSIEYNFQLMRSNILDIEVIYTPPDTVISELNAETRYFKLIENPVSGEIRFNLNPPKNWEEFNVSFQRYSDSQRYNFHVPGIPYAYEADWQFAADSGLIHGSFYLISHHTKRYSIVLDSLNLVQ